VFVSTGQTWQCSRRKLPLKNKNDGREVMKSFQVAEFNASLKEVDQETP